MRQNHSLRSRSNPDGLYIVTATATDMDGIPRTQYDRVDVAEAARRIRFTSTATVAISLTAQR